MAVLVLFNKPFGVLSQFTDGEDRPTLRHYIKLPDVYPAGRLDHDSEGLLLLTDDGQLQHQIAHPSHKLPKTYWVQVEGAPNSYTLTKLRQGVELNDGMTQPAEVRLIPTPALWKRDPPIRDRINIPTQWLEITITEGRNRQVRRMTAAVGHPTLRLIRVKIGNWTLEGIEPGKYKTETLHLPKTAPALPSRTKSRSHRDNRNSVNASRASTGAANTTTNTNTNTNNSTGKQPDKKRLHTTATPKTGGNISKKNSGMAASTPQAPSTASKKAKTQTLVIQKPKSKLDRDPY